LKYNCNLNGIIKGTRRKFSHECILNTGWEFSSTVKSTSEVTVDDYSNIRATLTLDLVGINYQQRWYALWPQKTYQINLLTLTFQYWPFNIKFLAEAPNEP